MKFNNKEMNPNEENTSDNNNPSENEKAATAKPLKDGVNTPVPDQEPTPELSASEAALFKQADNPLGDPHKT